MKTSVAFDKLCDSLPIIKNIVDKAKANPEILEQLKTAADAKNKLDYLVAVPPILKSCKDEVFAMLAVWNDMSVEMIAEQPISATIKQVMGIFADGDVMSFFSFAQGNAQESTDTDESSTTSETTEENSETETTGTPLSNYDPYARFSPIE